MEAILIVSSGLLWVVVLFNLLLTFALIRRLSRSPTTAPHPYEGLALLQSFDPAPDFRLESLDGKTMTLASYRGRFVAFIFFNLGCTTCMAELPQFEALAAEAEERGLELVLVNTADSRKAVESFFQSRPQKLPVLLGASSSIINDYKVPGVPFFCVVNHEGRVIWVGYIDHRWDTVLKAMREGMFLNLDILSWKNWTESVARREAENKEVVMN
jgi:peroxiredoxin